MPAIYFKELQNMTLKALTLTDGMARCDCRKGGIFRSMPGLPGLIVALVLAIVSMLATPMPSQARVVVDITKGNVEPLPIAITPFGGELGQEISSIIEANLRNSGLFRPIERAAFIEKISDHNAVPRFEDWRVISAQALVTGNVTKTPDGRLKAEFRLWDVFGSEQIIGQQYFTNPENKRRLAHIISDAIYKELTGESGYFDSRIVFIDETGPKTLRKKRLAIMDQDGANLRFLSYTHLT